MEEKDPKEYRFLEEETKDLPKNRKKLVRRLLLTVLFAVIFGFVACLVFYLLRPAVQNFTENLSQEDPSSALSEYEEELSAQEETAAEENETAGTQEAQEFTAEDYESVQKELYSIGRQANHSVVLIESVTSQKDWFEDDYETTGVGTGIIIEKTSSQILILTDRSLIADASEVSVSFYGGGSCSAELQGYDAATGIAILLVNTGDLDSDTAESAEPVSLESSSGLSQGMTVIAVGSPQGEARSILTGTVTAVNREVSVTDANYRVMTTDIPAESDAGGILINRSGEAVGLICRGSDSETLKAYLLTELDDLIERLSEGTNAVSLGLSISEVTQSVAQTYDLPTGVYITGVESGSAASEAGLQAGDVVVKIGGTEITSESDYEKKLLSLTKDQTISIQVMRQGSDGTYQDVTCKAEITID